MNSPEKKFMFAAVVGSGLTAKAADNAGADYLLALNAGRFRVQGASSLTCFMPVRPANDWVFEFAEREILGRCSAGVFAGLSVNHPQLDMDELISRTKALGFAGVCNFPSAILIEGRLGQRMEQQGLGFERELELVRRATSTGLKSFVYVATNGQARAMAKAGATAVCVNLGFTSGGTGVSTHLTLETAASQIDHVLEGVATSIDRLCHGGPITSPEEALAVMRISRVQGFVAGSTLDRLPIEQALGEVTKSFKAIPGLTRVDQEPIKTTHALIGSSLVVRDLRKTIEDLAGEDVPVLITGETGTGKSLIARILHDKSPARRRDPMVVDCLGLSSEKSDAVLLGHAAGAGRVGAASARGMLEQADGSTIIFEEIAALDLKQQSQILRFADEKLVQRIGDISPMSVKVRIVSTTSNDLRHIVELRLFRADLFFRLCGHELKIPALRERADDIPELAIYFGRQINGGETLRFSNSALSAMLEYDWPGNIRELRSAVGRMIKNAKSHHIDWRAVDFLSESKASNIKESQKSIDAKTLQSERDWIAQALTRNGFRRGPTAQELGITTRTLYNKVKKYGL